MARASAKENSLHTSLRAPAQGLLKGINDTGDASPGKPDFKADWRAAVHGSPVGHNCLTALRSGQVAFVSGEAGIGKVPAAARLLAVSQ